MENNIATHCEESTVSKLNKFFNDSEAGEPSYSSSEHVAIDLSVPEGVDALC